MKSRSHGNEDAERRRTVNDLGADAGIHHGDGGSGIAVEERISGGGESNPSRTRQRPLLLSDAEKTTLAEMAHRLGRKALAELASAAKPDTLFRWYRDLIAKKFDGSRFRKSRGRPPLDEEIERLVVRMARENPSWGYDRIAGAMANLGHQVSDQTVGNILKRRDLPPSSTRPHDHRVTDQRLRPQAPRTRASLRRPPGESDNAIARVHEENSWPGSKAVDEPPPAVNGENSREKMQNVRGDSSA